MSDHENATLESKCRFLRQQLSALGYDNEFSTNSIPLLENLVSDLLQTTDTLKHYKHLSQDCLQACHDLETFVDSYKKDNAWLVRELNTLNLNSIIERTAYEKRISELERDLRNVKDSKTDTDASLKARSRLCQKTNYERPSSSCSRSEPFKASCKSLREKCNQYEDTIRNKDTEIQQLYSEIFRLNHLLSEGRPVDAVLKETNDEYNNELFEMRQKNAELQRNLNEAILSSHEAKCNALKLAGRHPHQSCGCFSIDDKEPKNVDKPDASKEKLKQIEDELNNLKLKYQKLELVSKSPEKVSAESPRNKLASEVVSLKESIRKLEQEKAELQSKLQEAQSAYDELRQSKGKVDKEVSELKRLHQESESDRAEKEKSLRKCLDNKRLLVNRVQELSIIERDLTLEITRLCNINAVHKRHILELETKLLDIYQRKGKENLSSDLLITKKPLEKRNTKSTAATKSTKSPGDADSKTVDGKSLNVVSRIREKYNQQIDIIQEEQRNLDLSEFNMGLGISNLKPEVVSFTDEIKLLNNKVDNLKNILLEKEKLISNLQLERQELNNTLKEVTSTLQKTHECDHCKLAERMIAEYKEKLLKLEVEKRELQQSQADYQRTIDCNNQHIMQLRTEMHELQMELQLHKTDSSRFSKLEEETCLSVQSSKVLQKQLEVQLESTMKQLRLMEKETSKAKTELLSMRDENLKLQRMIMDLETEKEKLSTLSAEKSKKLSTLEKTLKSKEYKLTNLEDVINDFKKQLSSNSTQTDGSRKSTNAEHLRMQIRNLEKARDQATAENKQLKRDLNSLTQDYLACKKELDNSRKETQDLNVQVHDYIAKVRAAEETLQQKDKERSEMLEHFRTLTVEATQLGSNNMTLESEARSTLNSLRNAESKIANLESEIESKDRLVSSYLEQIDVLTKNIARLETQVSNLTDQRDRLQAELDSCELMCGRMEKHEDLVSGGKCSGRKMGDELYRLYAENERLQKNLCNEKSNVTALEHMLSETRDGIEHNVSIDELQDEIRGLKANIKCLQEALESTNRQLRHTQSEASDYQRQIIQLNRDLRNLQFENLRNTADHTLKCTDFISVHCEFVKKKVSKLLFLSSV